jgi:hypothetical protein
MATELKPGIYDANVSDYGVTETKKGDPMAMIRFQYLDQDGDMHFATWYGTFTHEKSKEISCDVLALCGYSSNNLADLAKGKGSGVLSEHKKVSITLTAEEWEGKTRIKVKYVNPPGGSGFRSQMTHADAVKKFAGVSLGAAMIEAKKKYGKEIKNEAPTFDSEEPIPF